MVEPDSDPDVLVISSRPDFAHSMAHVLQSLGVVTASFTGAQTAFAAVGRGLRVLVVDEWDAVDPEVTVALASAARRAAPGVAIFLVYSRDAMGSLPAREASDLARAIYAVRVPLACAGPTIRRFLAAKGSPAPPDWVERSVARLAASGRITPAEARGVVAAAVRGRSNKAIGRELGKTLSTVRTHLSNVCRKLGVASRSELSHFVSSAVAERPPEGAPRALVVCDDTTLRERAILSLEDAGIAALVLDRASARAVLKRGCPEGVIGVVVDRELEPPIEEIVDLARGGPKALPCVVLARGAPAEAFARAHGATALGGPFHSSQLLRGLGIEAEQPSRPAYVR